MFEENENNIMLFPKKTTYEIGKTNYIVTSHYDENAESLIEKIKNLLKADIHEEIIKSGFTGIKMV